MWSRRARLEAEKQKIEGVQSIKAQVQLNVGGSIFMTSTSTLRAKWQDHSMLEAMFSGRHALEQDEDGSFFIDRDGTHFWHILNYLRSGAVQVELDSTTARELALEAEFYGLADLAATLRTETVDITQFLGPEIARMRREEVRLREPLGVVKPTGPGASAVENLHGGLVSVFEDDGVLAQLNAQDEDPMHFPTLMGRLSSKNPKSTKPCGRRPIQVLFGVL